MGVDVGAPGDLSAVSSVVLRVWRDSPSNKNGPLHIRAERDTHKYRNTLGQPWSHDSDQPATSCYSHTYMLESRWRPRGPILSVWLVSCSPRESKSGRFRNSDTPWPAAAHTYIHTYIRNRKPSAHDAGPRSKASPPPPSPGWARGETSTHILYYMIGDRPRVMSRDLPSPSLSLPLRHENVWGREHGCI